MWFLGLLKGLPWWAIAIAALLSWGQYNKWQAKHQAKKADQAIAQSAQSKATAAEEQNARTIEFEFAEKARKQADAYAETIRRTERSTAALRAERDRLLGAISVPARPASASAAADGAACGCDDSASVRIVAGECVGALEAMAPDAEANRIRLIALQTWVREQCYAN